MFQAGDRFRLHDKGAECVVVGMHGELVKFAQPTTGITGYIRPQWIKIKIIGGLQ
jgi:hypothetical protein